jgi:hypothetical protein
MCEWIAHDQQGHQAKGDFTPKVVSALSEGLVSSGSLIHILFFFWSVIANEYTHRTMSASVTLGKAGNLDNPYPMPIRPKAGFD